MDDLMINPILLSSSFYLANVEKLIKHLEEQTFNIDHLEDCDNKQRTISKTLSSNTIPIDDISDNSFLTKSITHTNDAPTTNHTHDHCSIENLTVNDNSNHSDELIKKNILSSNEQNFFNNQDREFTWDDQYDTHTNYCLTLRTDKPELKHSDLQKFHQSINQKIHSTNCHNDLYSNLPIHMNDWSMQPDFNTIEQSVNQIEQINSESKHSLSSNRQQLSNNNSSYSSTSWRHMKQNQRTAADIERKEMRPLSPLSLYQIFQRKSNTITSSSRNAFQLYRQCYNSMFSNFRNQVIKEKTKSSSNTVQTIQTSIRLDNSNQQIISISKSKSCDQLDKPCSVLSSAVHKSLPDLSFVSQYSKELPHIRTPSSSINIARTTPSPTLIQQQKQDCDRPRTLKSIKRYKNSKHSTEPLGVFYSPQLRKTFAAVPLSTITKGSNASPTLIKMKLNSPSLTQSEQHRTSNFKSCLNNQLKVNSCDIRSISQDSTLSLSIPDLVNKTDSSLVKSVDFLQSSKNLNTNSNSSDKYHHSKLDLLCTFQPKNSTKTNDHISQCAISPCNSTTSLNNDFSFNENRQRLRKRTITSNEKLNRCQTDIIVIDPVLHRPLFNDSPPNEFRLQQDDILMENSYTKSIPDLDEPVPIVASVPSSPFNQLKIEKETNLPNQRLISTNTSILDDLLQKINDIIKHLFEIKRSDKAFFLNNEHNSQLDSLLKNDLCSAIQTMLEHGRKDHKKITLWKIIEISISRNTSSSSAPREIPLVYFEAKRIAQNTSSFWLYKFQAFIFVLLNKNELINWLYYFTRQKGIIQRYYQSPDALVLVSIPSTFNLFERIMTQLEKLAPLAFQLTYRIPNTSLTNNDQLDASMISIHSTKASARDWLMTISRRTSRNLTQAVIPNRSNDTFRSMLSKKLNGFLTRTANMQQARRSSNIVTETLPESNQQTLSPESLYRLHESNTVTKHFVSSQKHNDSAVRNVSSPAASPTNIIGTFQSKISRPLLNIDRSKSNRYHCATSVTK